MHAFARIRTRVRPSARDRARRRIASPHARSRSRARGDTATDTRVNFQSTRPRDRRPARRVASHPRPRAFVPRTPARDPRPIPFAFPALGRIVVESSSRTARARLLRARHDHRSRFASEVVRSRRHARAVRRRRRRPERHRPHRHRRVKSRDEGAGAAMRGWRSRGSFASRVSSIARSVGSFVGRDRSIGSVRPRGPSIDRSVGRMDG